MYEEDVASPADTRPHSNASGDHSPILKYLLLAVALIYVIASLYFMYTLKNRLDAQEAKQQSLEATQTDLAARFIDGTPPRREDLGLPVDGRLYVCGQNPIKFHPEFDSAIGEILVYGHGRVLPLGAWPHRLGRSGLTHCCGFSWLTGGCGRSAGRARVA
jgi:hypothetical protein